MVEKQVIFFPKTTLGISSSVVDLLGFTDLIKNVRYFYVLPDDVEKTSPECQAHAIGHFTRSDCQLCSEKQLTNVLCISENNGKLNASLSPGQLDNFLLVIYDPLRLYDYGTSLENKGNSQKLICFKMLSKWLSQSKNVHEHNYESKFIVFQKLLQYLLVILDVLISSFESKVLQFTVLRLTTFQHILGVLKNYAWLVKNLIHSKHVLSKSKAVNYLMSCICDAIFGITILYLLNSSFTSSNELFSYISSISHVSALHLLIMCLCFKLYCSFDFSK